eukprot:TRINITY_DN1969_c0_g1_i1.p1 TRINITY_DN1969_c0_g1~~TRINITY_DN1969_c0_g1_i1.p1  ORF type:complete len:630 (+),score=201.71 TRINITY_DN1969_c0_g1_i1:77-1966(+)
MPAARGATRRSASAGGVSAAAGAVVDGVQAVLPHPARQHASTITAVLAGCLIMFVFNQMFAGPGKSDGAADLQTLLRKLDMEEYAPIVTARRLTVTSVALLSPQAAPDEGFKPYHWKRLVIECRKAVGGSPPVRRRRSSRVEEDPDEAGGADPELEERPRVLRRRRPLKRLRKRAVLADDEGADGDPEPAPPPRRRKQRVVAEDAEEPAPRKRSRPAAEEGEEAAAPKRAPAAAATPATPAPPPKVTPAPPPQPTPAPTPPPSPEPTPAPTTPVPKPSYPVVCRSWYNTALIRYMWQRWKGQAALPALNGTEPPKDCADYSVPPRDMPVAEPHLAKDIPTAAVAAERKWLKLGITKVHVEQLRARGIIDQLYVDHKLKMMYCAVPKSGCTGIKGWMLKGAGLFTGGSAHNKTLFKGDRLKVATFMTDQEVMDVLNNGEYFKWTIVRNPFTRVLATYLERFHQCLKQTRRTAQECFMWKKALVGRQPSAEAEAKQLSDDMSFLDYLNVLVKYREKQKPVNFLNAHWLPASEVCAMDEIEYDFVGRLEDKADMQTVYDLTGQQASFSKIQKKKLEHSEGTSTKLRTHYTDESHRIIAELYKKWDINQLGYTSTNVVPGHEAAGGAPPAGAA